MATKQQESEFAELYARADAAGRKAVAATVPTPMGVQESRLDIIDGKLVDVPVGQTYIVSGGVCGFAWVNIKPGTSTFARWLVKTGKARADSYYGGVVIWGAPRGVIEAYDGGYGQSMTLKEAYSNAFATVLREAGIRAHASSRMD